MVQFNPEYATCFGFPDSTEVMRHNPETHCEVTDIQGREISYNLNCFLVYCKQSLEENTKLSLRMRLSIFLM